MACLNAVMMSSMLSNIMSHIMSNIVLAVNAPRLGLLQASDPSHLTEAKLEGVKIQKPRSKVFMAWVECRCSLVPKQTQRMVDAVDGPRLAAMESKAKLDPISD
jgi:hypothetical protein